MSTKTVLRRARKRHRCDGCGLSSAIQPGARYLEGVAFPGDDAGHPDHPTRYRECRDCAERYGRGGRFPDEDGA
jgi:hypothetical protein